MAVLTIKADMEKERFTADDSLEHLTTEADNPASAALHRLSAIEIVRLMNREDATVAAAVAKEAHAIASAIHGIVDRLRHGGRLVYVGAGTSGRLGVLDATECPPTFNASPGQVVGIIAGGPTALTQAIEGAEDHPEFAAADLAAISLSSRDVVVGIATSGRTPYVLGALDFARRQRSLTIALTCNADSRMEVSSDITIAPIVGPEVLSGSTRLKAGTATKMILNMLSTGAMVLLGKTYGNLLVDLKATNTKLHDRARRIVEAITGLRSEAASGLLARCSGEVKTAIVSQLKSIEPIEARSLLAKSNGIIREALNDDDRNRADPRP